MGSWGLGVRRISGPASVSGLDMHDSIPGNDRNDAGSRRSALRLHPGNLSTGCITVPNSQVYQRVSDIIDSTTTTPFRDANGNTRENYGTLHVFTTSSPRAVLP